MTSDAPPSHFLQSLYGNERTSAAEVICKQPLLPSVNNNNSIDMCTGSGEDSEASVLSDSTTLPIIVIIDDCDRERPVAAQPLDIMAANTNNNLINATPDVKARYHNNISLLGKQSVRHKDERCETYNGVVGESTPPSLRLAGWDRQCDEGVFRPFQRHQNRSKSLNHSENLIRGEATALPLTELSSINEPIGECGREGMHFPFARARRSYSHPEQLNLVMADDKDVERDTNGYASRNRHSIHSSTSSPKQHNLSSEKASYNHTFNSVGAHKFKEWNGGLTTPGSDESMAFFKTLDETDRFDDCLWKTKPKQELTFRDHMINFIHASDNKLTKKLFGSKNALLKEKRRQMAANSWVIHPCSNFRLYWDLLMLIFLITNLVVLPVSIAFFYDDVGAHWIVFNVTCDVMFILDIVINFRTGLIDSESHGNVILDPKTIAKKYLKSWFIIDFVSSLPLDYVFLSLEGQSYSAGRALRILRLAKLLQLLRLLRISRLVRYVKLWQEFFSLASIVVKLFNLICIMVLVGHWSGCIQFFVPVIQGFPEDSWIVLNRLQESHWWEQYSKSLFKALSHMLCIGYGQFPPRNMTDTWLTIASMLAGATCYALFIGHATTLIQSFDTSSRQFRDHLQQVNEYMIYRKLPSELRRRITDYYDHRFGGKMFDEAAILAEVSDTLRKDIIYHNCRELVQNVPFFVGCEPSFVTDVVMKLVFEMFQPGDIIIEANTKGDRMFFIQEGVIEIIAEEKVVTRLGDGSYFGEICLLNKQKRSATVRAVTYCNLFSLGKDHFDIILSHHPLMKKTIEAIAIKRLEALGKDAGNLVTSRESLFEEIDQVHKVFDEAVAAAVDETSEAESEHRASPTPSGESGNQFLTVFKGFFTKDSEDFSPSRAPSMKSGLASADGSTLPRCKSAVNTSNVLSKLIMNPSLVPAALETPALEGRRAKSTADVQNLSLAQTNDFQENRLFDHPSKARGRRASLSPMFKRKDCKGEEEDSLPSSPVEQCWESAMSQPASPLIPNSSSKKTTQAFHNITAPPQVKITTQSNPSINLSSDNESDH